VERIGEQKASDQEVLALFQSVQSVSDSRVVNSWDPSFVSTVVGILESNPVSPESIYVLRAGGGIS